MIYGDPNIFPPFHENWDDVHCMECTVRSIIDHFEPDNDLSVNDIDQLCHKTPGKWSWPQFAVQAMLDRGYAVKAVVDISTEEMLQEGLENYLVRTQGKAAAEISIKNSIPMDDIERFLSKITINTAYNELIQLTELEDVKSLLNEGYLVMSIVNAKALNGKEGYSGHFVLIYAIDEKYIYFHDSGLPSHSNRAEKIDFFIECAKSPKETNWFIIGFKK